MVEFLSSTMPLVLIADEVAEDRGFVVVKMTHAAEHAVCYLTQDVFSFLAGAEVRTEEERMFLFEAHRARLLRALVTSYDSGHRPVVITSSDLRQRRGDVGRTEAGTRTSSPAS